MPDTKGNMNRKQSGLSPASLAAHSGMSWLERRRMLCEDPGGDSRGGPRQATQRQFPAQRARCSPAAVVGFAALAVAGLGGAVHLRHLSAGPAELLGKSPMRLPSSRRAAASTGLERRMAFTQALGGFSSHGSDRPEIHLETCGLLKRSCEHLVGREKMRCGLESLCSLHTSKAECDAEDGAACKHGESCPESTTVISSTPLLRRPLVLMTTPQIQFCERQSRPALGAR